MAKKPEYKPPKYIGRSGELQERVEAVELQNQRLLSEVMRAPVDNAGRINDSRIDALIREAKLFQAAMEAFKPDRDEGGYVTEESAAAFDELVARLRGLYSRIGELMVAQS